MRWIEDNGTEPGLGSFRAARSVEITSFLVDNAGQVRAWVIHPDAWYWAKFDDQPPRGPFESEAAAKLAAELLFRDVSQKEAL